jgi:hypothetical protein
VCAAQDLDDAPPVSARIEELGPADYDDLFRRELLEAIVPQHLGRIGLALLQREGRGRPAQARQPLVVVSQALHRRAHRGERLLGLLDAVHVEQRHEAGDERPHVVGLEGEEALHVQQDLFVLQAGEMRLDEKAQCIDPIRRELDHVIRRLDRFLGVAAPLEKRPRQQEPVLDGPVGRLCGLAQRPDRQPRLVGRQQCDAVEMV